MVSTESTQFYQDIPAGGIRMMGETNHETISKGRLNIYHRLKLMGIDMTKFEDGSEIFSHYFDNSNRFFYYPHGTNKELYRKGTNGRLDGCCSTTPYGDCNSKYYTPIRYNATFESSPMVVTHYYGNNRSHGLSDSLLCQKFYRKVTGWFAEITDILSPSRNNPYFIIDATKGQDININVTGLIFNKGSVDTVNNPENTENSWENIPIEY